METKTLQGWEVEAAKVAMREGRQLHHRHGRFHCGQRVTFAGQDLLVYDADACAGNPGFTLVLVDPSFTTMFRFVDPFHVSAFVKA